MAKPCSSTSSRTVTRAVTTAATGRVQRRNVELRNVPAWPERAAERAGGLDDDAAGLRLRSGRLRGQRSEAVSVRTQSRFEGTASVPSERELVGPPHQPRRVSLLSALTSTRARRMSSQGDQYRQK